MLLDDDDVERSEAASEPGRVLGSRVRAALAATPALGTRGPLVQLAESGGLDQRGRSLVRPWNVFFAVSPGGIVGAPTLPILAAVAVIRWSVDGATFEAEVDAGIGGVASNGVDGGGRRASVVANRVQLLGANEGTGIPIDMVGAIVPASASSPIEAQRTRYGGALLAASGSTETLNVPPWAIWYTLAFSPNNAGAGTTIETSILNAAGTEIDRVRWNTAALGQQSAEFRTRAPLPNDSFQIRSQAPAAAIDRYRVIFGLAI